MTRTYSTRFCWFCRQEISSNGLSKTSHMRAHVRKGEMVERKDRDGYLYFEAVCRCEKDYPADEKGYCSHCHALQT